MNKVLFIMPNGSPLETELHTLPRKNRIILVDGYRYRVKKVQLYIVSYRNDIETLKDSNEHLANIDLIKGNDEAIEKLTGKVREARYQIHLVKYTKNWREKKRKKLRKRK